MTKEIKERAEFLMTLFIEGKASLREKQMLFELMDQQRVDSDWQEIVEELMAVENEMAEYQQEAWQSIVDDILKTKERKKQKGILRSIGWKKWIAAASVLIVLSLGTYLFLKIEKETTLASAPQEERFKNDVQPGMNVPQLVLADGRIVNLQDAVAGSLATEGAVNITRLASGEIVYEPVTGVTELRYNTINNPRGSKVVSLSLSDGSRVWVNAGSSVTYPIAFVGNERKVAIDGEAYFEIAHNAAKPFKVTKGSLEVAVLGTHFNVNAYDDEEQIKVTLLEGKVQVSNTNSKSPNSKLLNPGQQAVILSGVEGNKSTIQLINPDLEHVMAWKNGRFHFDGSDIKTVMKQVERWYDVKVEFRDNINYSFVAKISRDEPVSELLKLLELTELVRFHIEGKKITVMK